MAYYPIDPDRDDPASPVPESLELGLNAGFGSPSRAADDPALSVLARIASSTGVRPRISLRDEASPSKVLRPLGSEAPERSALDGKYQVQGEIARGGVGVVLKGHDVDLGRDVAVKVLHEKYTRSPDLVQRFVEEAQIGGQLQHPGIVPVYDLGLSGERPYFTMKLIKGRTLAALLEERAEARSQRRRLLGVFEQVCHTMAYAHARGVIHRDLKPANVMVGAFGEVQVVDWGMGKVLSAGGLGDEERLERKSEQSVIETVRSQPGAGSTHSIVGSVMGTPAYMPPEQANGDVENMDERSDVFALGAILCEILTGSPPYVGKADELMNQAAKAQLDPCRRRLEESDVDEELRELCVDCLLPVPRARPRHAGVVAERTAAHLAAVEERARAAQIEAAEERVRAGAARRGQRLTLALAASVVVTLALGGGGAWWVERQAEARRSEAVRRVEVALGEADRLLGEARLAGAAGLELWTRATDAAEHAAGLADLEGVREEQRRRAQGVLARIGEEHDSVVREAEQRGRDERMHARLVRLRIPPDEDVRGDRWLRREAERMSRGYDEAFAEYLEGVRIEDLDVDQAVASLERSAVRIELAAALDHWALLQERLADEPGGATTPLTQRLHEIAGRVDAEDPWRARVRALLPDVAANRDVLERLAQQADYASLPAVSHALLAEALSIAGAAERAAEVLRRGRDVHPGDFGMCIFLSVLLERMEDPPLGEVVELLRVANALRPDMDEVVHRLANTLHKLERHEEALRACEVLSRARPDDQHVLGHTSWALSNLERFEELTELGRRGAELGPTEGWGPGLAYSWIRGLDERGKLDEALEVARWLLASLEAHESALAVEASAAAGDAGALEKARAALEKTRGRRADAAAEVERLEQQIEHGEVVEAILRGEREVSTSEEWTWLIASALHDREYARAARTSREAFVAHPELLADPLMQHAGLSSAALCGTGQGRDAGELDEAGRALWRTEAVNGLFTLLVQVSEQGAGPDREASERLSYLLRDPNLAGIRDEDAISALPAGERVRCRELWSAVRNVLDELRDRREGR